MTLIVLRIKIGGTMDRKGAWLPDLVILGLGLPSMDDVKVVHGLRG